MRLLPFLLTLLALVPAFGQDRRNTYIPETKTKFQPPRFDTLAAWEARASVLRRQLANAAGLLPMPAKTPLHAEIFGRIERRDYTIEKVYLETFPGFYLAGNLYRPLGKPGKKPGILAPHGHAEYGRLEHGPLFSVPSRGINSARQGYVVFAYDMIGYNDTAQIPHVFGGPREQLWGFGPLGMQTLNSIRALDFLASLPDVDAERLAVTGESGGGTQTFMLCALDKRPKWASPVNMISLIMQGGSPCENAPGLRYETNNVEIGALTAPRPMLMVSATGDWTRNTPREEFPAMQSIYRLYDKEALVETVQFDSPHNYHKDSREAVYKFFAKHILADPKWAEYTEKSIRQEKLQDLMVFWNRPMPANALPYPKLVEAWIAAAKKQNTQPVEAAEARERLRLSLAVEVAPKVEGAPAGGRVTLTRAGRGEQVPGLWKPGQGGAVLVLDPGGIDAARQSAAYTQAVQAGKSVFTIDAFQTGSAKAPRNTNAEHFLTFNRTDDANRVQDVLTAIAWLRQQGETSITVAGQGNAAIWATFAAAVLPAPVRLEAPLGDFRGDDQQYIDRFFIPGIQRAGGLDAARRLLSQR